MRLTTRDVACAAAICLAVSCTGADTAIGPADPSFAGVNNIAFAASQTDVLSAAPAINAAPVTLITAPQTNASFAQGASVTFTGGSLDPEQGALSGASLVWTSSRNGTIGTGTSFTTTSLAAGAHAITLVGKDAQGLTSSHSIIVDIVATTNKKPLTYVTGPASGSTFAQGAAVTFTGTSTDPEDGALSGAALSWSSSINGLIGTGTSVTTTTLSVGAHAVTLTGKDSKGATSTHSLVVTVTAAASGTTPTTNSAPVTLISAPVTGTVVAQGVAVTFTGSAVDPEQGALSGSSLVWTSSRDGAIGSGTSFTKTNLSAGAHTITLVGKDAQGASTSHSVIVDVIPTSTNAAPVAGFVAPLNNATSITGVPVVFTGTGSDAEDGVLAGASLVWTSSRDGQIGTGLTFTKSNLTVGVHTITLTVRDSKGAANSTSRTLTITSPSALAEPLGMTLIENRAFNCITSLVCESNWIFEQGQPNSMVIVSDPTAPKSPSNVAQMNYPAGMKGGGGPANAEFGFPLWARKQTIYVSMWIKLSSNFESHLTSINKIAHFFINGNNRIFTMARGDGTRSGALKPSFGLQSIAAPYFDGRATTATSVDLLPNVNTTTNIVRGQWQHHEIVLTGNTPGVANGSVAMWLDGKQVMNYTGIMFAAAGGSNTWSVMKWNPTWGGVGDTVVSSFYMQMDNVYISGK